ncbi:hypothetical protein [Chitinophaga sp.]|uniref:YdeI/OmpD-associated family protein n=1 Tax=Chitinophaga sp. TaxID=1869181 RepID=UPI002F95C13C
MAKVVSSPAYAPITLERKGKTIIETKDGKLAIYAKTRGEWRKWLQQNSQSAVSVWLIQYHKKSTVQTVSYNDAMEEALCFGWIDSKAKKRDGESFYLTMTPRNPKSKWSKPNRDRAERMIEKGRMMPPGQQLIDIAKNKGTWEVVLPAS